MQLQKSLLHQIARLFAVREIAQHDALERRRVTLEERAKCALVARDVRGHQFLVGLHGAGRRASVIVSAGSSAALVT